MTSFSMMNNTCLRKSCKMEYFDTNATSISLAWYNSWRGFSDGKKDLRQRRIKTIMQYF
jgi:hypothetical protein